MVKQAARRAQRQVNRRGEGSRLRADLIAAARRLSEEAGTLEALSMRAVAREAGVAATSVYLHFADRDELFQAAVADDYALLEQRMREAMDKASPDPFARLRAAARAYCDFATGETARFRMITEVRQPAPEQPHPADHPGRAIFTLLEEAVRACLAAGSPAPGDPALIVTCLWSGLHGYLHLLDRKPARPWPSPDRVVTHLVTALVPPADRHP